MLSDLNGPEFKGYLRKPLPDPTDEKVGALVGVYEAASPEDRKQFLEEVAADPGAGDTLTCYGERMATWAVREGSYHPLRSGMIALGMASPSVDFRYNVIATSLLYHSAQLLNAPWSELVEDVAPFVPPRPLERFRTFPDWEMHVRRPEAMGYMPEGSGKDFRYRLIPARTIKDDDD